MLWRLGRQLNQDSKVHASVETKVIHFRSNLLQPSNYSTFMASLGLLILNFKLFTKVS